MKFESIISGQSQKETALFPKTGNVSIGSGQVNILTRLRGTFHYMLLLIFRAHSKLKDVLPDIDTLFDDIGNDILTFTSLLKKLISSFRSIHSLCETIFHVVVIGRC